MSDEKPEYRTQPEHPHLRAYTSEEARIFGKIGAAKSAEARKKRRTMAEALDEYLSAKLQPSHPRYAEIKRMMRVMGLLGDGEEPDNQMLMLAGMMQRAQKDPTAAAFIRDTVGEKPTENIAATIDAPPPVVIGIHDAAWIESERKRQEAMVEEMRRTAVEVPAAEVEDADGAEGGQDAPGTRGAEGAQPSAGDKAAQQAGATAPSAAIVKQPPPKPKPTPPTPRPPAPPPRPVDPNVCLPSATPPM